MQGSNNQNFDKNGKKNDQDNKESKKSSESPSAPEISDQSSEIVEEGLMLCRTCMRFYPITEQIPIILPDELRDKKKDMDFLQRWNESIPNNLLKTLKPWTI